MNRTIYQAYDKHICFADIAGVEIFMSKEELTEMNNKMYDLMNNTLGIPDVQTRALMEQMFKRGYLAAHIVFGEYKE